MKKDIQRFIIPKKYFNTSAAYIFHIIVSLFFQEGLRAIILHRVSYWLHVNKCPGFAFCLAKIGYFFNNIYISPSTNVGEGCKINHGGTVIHAKKVGNFLEATHNVTIGQRTAMADPDTYPEIGDNVYIGAGARIFASVGDNVVVAANSVVLVDIPDNSRAVGVPAKVKPHIQRNKSDSSAECVG